MNTKLMVVGLTMAFSLSAFCGGIQISNVQAAQRSKDTGMVDVTFDVTSSSNTVSVILSAMNTDNNQTVKMNAVYDDQGNFLGNPAKIEPGNARHLVWNSALDLGKGFYSSSMVVTVRATEYDLPPSRIKQYIDGKEAEGRLLEEARASAVEALENAKAAYKAADEANTAAIARVNTAKEGVEDVTFESLTKQIAAAKATLQAASNSLAATSAAYGVTNAIYIASKDDYNDQMAYTTNSAWTVAYINGSQHEAVVTGTGLTKFDACIEEFKYFTFTHIDYGTTEFNDYANAKKFVVAQNAKTDELKAKMDANAANLATAGQNLAAARQAVVFGEKAVLQAELRLKNIYALQAQAQAELTAAQSEQSQTQAALNTATTAVATAQVAVNKLCD